MYQITINDKILLYVLCPLQSPMAAVIHHNACNAVQPLSRSIKILSLISQEPKNGSGKFVQLYSMHTEKFGSLASGNKTLFVSVLGCYF